VKLLRYGEYLVGTDSLVFHDKTAIAVCEILAKAQHAG
jgi:hypothetical protein